MQQLLVPAIGIARSTYPKLQVSPRSSSSLHIFTEKPGDSATTRKAKLYIFLAQRSLSTDSWIMVVSTRRRSQSVRTGSYLSLLEQEQHDEWLSL